MLFTLRFCSSWNSLFVCFLWHKGLHIYDEVQHLLLGNTSISYFWNFLSSDTFLITCVCFLCSSASSGNSPKAWPLVLSNSHITFFFFNTQPPVLYAFSFLFILFLLHRIIKSTNLKVRFIFPIPAVKLSISPKFYPSLINWLLFAQLCMSSVVLDSLLILASNNTSIN